jgi:hypothetical protein
MMTRKLLIDYAKSAPADPIHHRRGEKVSVQAIHFVVLSTADASTT